MSRRVNTYAFAENKSDPTSAAETVIRVDDVSMVFNMASEQLGSLKEYMIALAKRELRFKEFKALDNVSIDIKKGDVFGILGTNGSGKSTLLKIIAGVLKPTEGNIHINGNIAPLIELGAGFDPDLTARENIFLNGALLGYPKSLIEDKFDEIVEFAEIREFLEIPIKNYSSGMVARIAFAISTIIIPDILLVDEVLSVGDFMFQRKCENKIRQLIEEYGVTVLLVSHSNEQIERLCNRAIWIEKGKCRLTGEAAEVCKVYSGLGGRTGSKQSEEKLFGLLENMGNESDYPSLGQSIEGNPFKIAVELAKRSRTMRDKIETIILVSTATHINALFANSIAKKLDAPILPIAIDGISAEILKFLYEERPNRIIYVDCGFAGRAAFEELCNLQTEAEIINLAGTGNVAEYSKLIIDFGTDNNLFKSTEAIVIEFDDDMESIALTPYIYRSSSPILLTRPEAGEDDLTPLLHDKNFISTYDIVTLGSASNDAGLLKQCAKLPIKHIANDIERSNRFRRILELDNEESASLMCIISLSEPQWINYIGLGRYVIESHSQLVAMDQTSLDSMDECIESVKSSAVCADQITIVGSEGEFSSLSKLMIRAATKDCRSHSG